jgi:hypothetical protein
MTPGVNVGVFPDSPEGPAELVLALLAPRQFVALERRRGDWGLWYSFEPGIVKVGNAQPHSVPLRDAPLDVRERFLHRSEQFFRDYLELCRGRLGTMSSAVASGDRTIQLLQNLSLE